MEFTVKSNIGDFLSNMTRRLGGAAIDNAVAKAINNVLEEGQEMIRTDTPVKTGALRASILIRRVQPGGSGKGAIYSDLHYAPFIEFGTSRGIKPYAMFRKNMPFIHQRVKEEILKEVMSLANPWRRR